jgi:hypothetical protein
MLSNLLRYLNAWVRRRQVEHYANFTGQPHTFIRSYRLTVCQHDMKHNLRSAAGLHYSDSGNRINTPLPQRRPAH